MNILMVAPTSFFSDYGGHIRILEETLALEANGQSVTIVTYFKGTDVLDLDIRRTPPLPWHADYEVGSSRHKIAFDIYLAAKAFETGLRIRPDIVHGHMHEGALIGSLVAKVLGVPLVFDFQGGLTAEMVDHGFLNPNGRSFRWMRRIERYICQLPDAILTSSLRAQNLLGEQFGVNREIVHPLPDCVDVNRFDPARFSAEESSALRRKLGIPDGRIVVAYLGLLADYQGTPDLIEAASILKKSGEEVHFLIMGFPRVQQYRALAEKRGVGSYITFTGKVDYGVAPYYLSLGDIAVSAKVSATEGSGKVLNYMSMGLPIVAYDTAVHQEYLADSGQYAETGNVEELAASIAKMAHDPEWRVCLGGKLRKRAMEQYSWQQAGEKIAELYLSLT